MQNRITVLVAFLVAIMLTAAGAQPGDAQTNQAKTKSANECLSRPQGVAPSGKHWWYRIDRPTGRRCWYLGAEKAAGQKATRSQRRAAARLRTRREPPAVEPAPVETPAPAEVAAPIQSAANAAPQLASASTRTAVPSVPDAVTTRSPAAALDRDSTSVAVDKEANAILAAQEEMPLVWPALAETAATAGQRSDAPASSLGHLLMFVLTAAAFVAVAIHTIVKLRDMLVGRRVYQQSAATKRDRELEFAPAPPIQAAPLPYDVPRFLVAPRGHGHVRDLSRRRVWNAEADAPASRRRAVA